MKITRIALILGLVILLSVGIALAQPPGDVAAKKKQANADLDIMAQEISKLVTHPGFRGFLRSEIVKSKNRENILELDKFLDRATKQKGMPPGLAKLKDSAKKAQTRLKASGIQALEGYDLYFPVEAHRAKWKGGKDFLVAFSPVDDEKDTKQIIAYRVNDGKRVILDPNKPPQTPVLVLVAEEHVSHTVPPGKPVNTKDSDQRLLKPQFKGNDAPENKVPQSKGNSYVGVRRLYVRDDKEPWTRGNPEYVMFFGQRKGNYCIESYTHSWKGYTNWTFLNPVDKERTWYTTWNAPYSSGTCSDRYSTGTCWYFDDNYFSKYVLYIYEYDGGSNKPFIYTIYPGVTCSWTRSDGDDYVDSATGYKTNFPFNYDYKQDLGNAYVYWHKVH